MKYLIAAIMAVCMVAFAAQAGPPPGGWGTDCTNYITYSLPWSAEMCYNPLLGPGGDGFVDCATGQPVVWPALDVELWIEMECLITFEETAVDIHRASNYDDIYLYFDGTTACNNGQYIIVNPPPGGSLNALPFVEDMFHRTVGDAIPAYWAYSLDGSDYNAMTPEGANYMFLVGVCDHSFVIRLRLDLVYHQGDGDYWWPPGGFLCPAVPL